MAGKVITGRELARREFDLLDIPEPWHRTLGDIEQKAYGLVWGQPGSGKSTLMLALAQMLTAHGRVLYAAVEEGHSVTLQDKVRRVKAFDVDVMETSDLSYVRGFAAERGNEAAFIVVDSISEADPMSREIENLRTWCKESGIGLWVIAHALKGGDNYKGPSHLAHGTDVVAMVTTDGVFMTQKNRYAATGEDAAMAVPFELAEGGGIELRDNPVPVPFTTTLGQIIASNGNAARWVSKINELVGFRYGCMARPHSGASPRAKLSFRKERFGKTKSRPQAETVVTMLMDGEVYDEICAPNSKEAIALIKERHGELEIEITEQDHARAVLGAKEYRRQEREHADRGKGAKRRKSKAKKSSKSKPKTEAKKLPYEPKRFFDFGGEATELGTGDMVHAHRPTAAKTRKAERLMREAYAGRNAKRGPVEVRRRDDGKYVVVDGNHTLKVARQWGWPRLPASVLELEETGAGGEFDERMDRLEALFEKALK